MAIVAGADALGATGLAVSMVAIQTAIGVLNDIVDAPFDAGRKTGKPIPAGVIGRAGASRYGLAVGAIGLILALGFGLGLLALAIVVLGIGSWYDLRAKGTPWSWLPFALGIPLLPVYGWYGAAGALPPWFAWLIPAAVLAGAALAVANARADAERDAAAGITSVATALGIDGSWRLGAALLAGALVLVAAGLVREDAAGAAGGVGVALVGVVAALVGVVAGRSGGPERRERSWQAQAIGVALIGVGAIASVAMGQ